MSTKQSAGKKGGKKYAEFQSCNASKEELLRGDKYNPWDEYLVCWRSHGVKCLIGDHYSNQPTGNKNNGVDALKLSVSLISLLHRAVCFDITLYFSSHFISLSLVCCFP
jgi:hypothetical protein